VMLLEAGYPAEGLLFHRAIRSFRFDSILPAQRDRPGDLIRGSLAFSIGLLSKPVILAEAGI
jgi:hypothetical protein